MAGGGIIGIGGVQNGEKCCILGMDLHHRLLILVASLDFWYKMMKAEATFCCLGRRFELGWLVGPFSS